MGGVECGGSEEGMGVSVEQELQLCRLRSEERWCLVMTCHSVNACSGPELYIPNDQSGDFHVYLTITTARKEAQRNRYCTILISNSKPRKPLIVSGKTNLYNTLIYFLRI